MMSTVSRMRRSGVVKGTPWKCSITRWPDDPRPHTMRPPDNVSSAANSCAMAAGEREYTFRMEVPMWMRSVWTAKRVIHGTVDGPHASPVATSS